MLNQSLSRKQLRAASQYLDNFGKPCLWPAPYNVDTLEAVTDFVLCCWTWNESDQEHQQIPDLPYIRQYIKLWYENRARKGTMVTEKCRRMLISWVSRACELWDMGLKRGDGLLVGEDLEAASKHVWRFDELYSQLSIRYPTWKLKPPKTHKHSGERELRSFTLPNGSVVRYANGEAKTIQGDGLASVTMEEPSLYPFVSGVLAQAKIVTQGKSGAKGGYRHGVCNACAENSSWQEIKQFWLTFDAKPLLPPREGYPDGGMTIRETPGGEWFVELDWWADLDRDRAWLEETRLEFESTPFQFREQILRQDAQVADALWDYELLNELRVDKYPPLVAVGIGIDPSVSDPEKRKNKYKKPDECGLIVGGVDGVGRGYVLEDVSGIMSPEKWAQTACRTLKKWQKLTNAPIVRMVYEKNQGGELVAMAIRNVWPTAPLQDVHAAIGKRARAEPISQGYEQRRIHHVGQFNMLERQMCTWDSQNPSSPSPGRIDALVWLFHAFGLDKSANITRQRFSAPSQTKPYDKRRYVGFKNPSGEAPVLKTPEELMFEDQNRR